MATYLATLLFASFSICTFLLQNVSAVETLTWCLVSTDEASACTNMTAIFNRIDTSNRTWACFQASSTEECTTALANKQADFVTLDGGDIYASSVKYGFQVVAQEQNAAGGTEYWGVGVVRASQCSSGTKLSDFKGKNACHTGYRRASGWLLPVWTMAINSTELPQVNADANVNNDIESVEAYYNNVCAPGDDTSGKVCSLCPNECNSDTSAYVSYPGALNCLMNGGGDIAFTKNGIADEYASDGVKNQTWSTLAAKDLKLVCPQGGCADLSAYKNCHFGFVKGHAVVTRSDLPVEDIEHTIEIFTAANSDATFVDLFFSGKNSDDLIFKADTQRLAAVYPKTVEQYLGDEYSVYRDVVGLDTSVKLGTSGVAIVPMMSVASLLAVCLSIMAMLF